MKKQSDELAIGVKEVYNPDKSLGGPVRGNGGAVVSYFAQKNYRHYFRFQDYIYRIFQNFHEFCNILKLSIKCIHKEGWLETRAVVFFRNILGDARIF